MDEFYTTAAFAGVKERFRLGGFGSTNSTYGGDIVGGSGRHQGAVVGSCGRAGMMPGRGGHESIIHCGQKAHVCVKGPVQNRVIVGTPGTPSGQGQCGGKTVDVRATWG